MGTGTAQPAAPHAQAIQPAWAMLHLWRIRLVLSSHMFSRELDLVAHPQRAGVDVGAGVCGWGGNCSGRVSGGLEEYEEGRQPKSMRPASPKQAPSNATDQQPEIKLVDGACTPDLREQLQLRCDRFHAVAGTRRKSHTHKRTGWHVLVTLAIHDGDGFRK